MRERDIERHLVTQVKQLGGEVRKVKWVGRKGAPDRVVMLPWGAWRAIGRDPGDTVIWVELKATGKKAERHQVREHRRMKDMGQIVVVIDSIEGVDKLLGVAS